MRRRKEEGVKGGKALEWVWHPGTKPLCSQFITGGSLQTPSNAFTAVKDEDEDDGEYDDDDGDGDDIIAIKKLIERT